MKLNDKTISTLRAAIGVVRQHRQSAVYPALAYVVVLMMTFIAVLPTIQSVLMAGMGNLSIRFTLIAVVYCSYGLLYFVTTFFSVCMVTAINANLDGERKGFRQVCAYSIHRVRSIVTYTIVSATLGAIVYTARLFVGPLFGSVLVPTVGKRIWERWHEFSYDIAILMALPVIALDDPRPKNPFRRAVALVEQTWGEHTKPARSLGMLAILPGVLLFVLLATPTIQEGLASHSSALIRTGLLVALISSFTYIQLNAFVNAIFALAAYRYATRGENDLCPGDESFGRIAFVNPRPTKLPLATR